MAFSEETVKKAFENAGQKCESCGKQLSWGNRGDNGHGKWEAHHKKAVKDGGSDTLGNCKILCTECHTKTKSYGSHN
jgi:5-methylcytosine-specific restriction endonuclease McrA